MQTCLIGQSALEPLHHEARHPALLVVFPILKLARTQQRRYLGFIGALFVLLLLDERLHCGWVYCARERVDAFDLIAKSLLGKKIEQAIRLLFRDLHEHGEILMTVG